MKFERRLSKNLGEKNVRDAITWNTRDVAISGRDFTATIEVPITWSDRAATILADKYLRRAGVPSAVTVRDFHDGGDMPVNSGGQVAPWWLFPSVPARNAELGGETSAAQVFHRLAGCWAYWGWREGLLTMADEAQIFYDEVFLSLATQEAAPNSPQWFNTGLWWAYGIEGTAAGSWYVDASGHEPLVRPAKNAYQRPQPHACFIQPVTDDLVNDGGIMDLVVREARLFKFGSGSGTNPSTIRSKDELLSGGGKASGMMSFLRVSDRAAGSIKSGGTTRRAAKMWNVDLDHPEAPEFISWKSREDYKAAAMSVGSRLINAKLAAVSITAHGLSFVTDEGNDKLRSEHGRALKEARAAGVPEALIDRAIASFNDWPELDLGWESEPIESVSGQNANNSVRVSNAFMRTLAENGTWSFTARVSGEIVATMPARELWDLICREAWACADPGLQFDDTINEWHTCPGGGRIRSSNPCGEYNFLDNTSCNLASLRLTAFMRHDGEIDLDAFQAAVRLWTVVLEISVEMASFPSKEIALNTHLYRTLGLGYADLGGLLMRKGIAYDSPAGRDLAAALTSLMTGTSYATSALMAREVGPFPEWKNNSGPMWRVIRNHARASGVPSLSDYEELTALPVETTKTCRVWDRAKLVWNDEVCGELSNNGFRNAQVTLLAPTGTISFAMDCDTTGIEPDLSLIKHKKLAGGGYMTIPNEAVEPTLRALGYSPVEVEKICEKITETGSVEGSCLSREHLAIFDTANPAFDGGRFIRPMAHVEMVAVVQPFLSGAVSKTINLPRRATITDVAEVFQRSWELGLKSVTVYRDGCKLSQPLSVASNSTTPITAGANENPTRTLRRGERHHLPSRRFGITQKIHVDGAPVYLRTGAYPDGSLGEIFLDVAQEGASLRSWVNAFAKLFSIALQYGAPLHELVDAFLYTRFEPAGIVTEDDRIKSCLSIPDYVARYLAIEHLGRDDLAHVANGTGQGVRTDAEGSMTLGPDEIDGSTKRSGNSCPVCGGTLRWTGTCQTCDDCGTPTGGCS